MKFAKRFFLIYLLLKPFYLFKSGGLQIGDAFLLLSLVSLIISLKINVPLRQKFIDVINDNKHFVIFTVLALMVNVIYFLIFSNFEFLLSTLYFIFILIAIVLFGSFLRDRGFLVSVSKVFKFNLLLQVFLFITNLGKMYDPTRYMGTLNDPNQFGYYILISFFFIYVIKIVLDRKERVWPYFLIALFLIFLSASTGMILGLGMFLVLSLAYKVKSIAQLPYKTVQKAMYIISIIVATILFIVLPLSAILSNERNVLKDSLGDSVVLDRLTQKVDQASNEKGAELSVWEDRGYDKIFHYPQYVLFGSGQGMYERFTKAATELEVHATFPATLFYYGIIPFAILLKWIYGKLKSSRPELLIVYAALFIESFTLLNQRQTLFWMIIMLAGISVVNTKVVASPIRKAQI